MKKSDFLYGNGKTRIFGVSDNYTTNSSDVVASTKCVYDAIDLNKLIVDNKTTNIVAGEVVVKDVLFNNLISLTDSGALGKARYIPTSQSFNIDTDDFDLVVINASSENSSGTYPPFPGFLYIRQFYYSRTSSTVIGNRMQVAFAYNANRMWRRYHLDGSWSAWVQVIDKTDLATVSTPGIVQLNNTTSSTSTTQAATANAVKIAYNKAVEAYTKAENAQGSSASADKLTTARTIGITGVVTGTATAFDGTKNISIDATKLNIEDTGITGELPIAHGGTGRTDGKAVGLVTKRTIDGVSFDGSANITHFGTCSTAAATAAKVVSVPNFVLATGAEVTVRFTVTNTAASPTLNVNNTEAKAIVYRNAAISAGYLAANRVYKFVYDGTNYELIGDIDTNTTYSAASTSKAGIVQLNDTTSSTSTTQAATAHAVKLAYDKANSALPKAGGTLTGAVVEKISALSGTSVALDLKTSNNFTHTVTANTTFTVAANTGTSFQLGTLVLTNAGNYTITWPESFKWADNTPPTLNSEGIDVITFFTINGGTTYYAAQAMTGIE